MIARRQALVAERVGVAGLNPDQHTHEAIVSCIGDGERNLDLATALDNTGIAQLHASAGAHGVEGEILNT